MKKFLQLAIAHLYYTFMVAMFTSLGLIAIWWKYGETAEGQATLIVFAWCGLVASIGTFAIMMVMWVAKWPKTVNWFDIAVGIDGLAYGIWLTAKILWPGYTGDNVPAIFFRLVAVVVMIGTACAFKYREDSRRQPVPSGK